MEDLKKELKELLEKYNASIQVNTVDDDSFMRLELHLNETFETIDAGYRDLSIFSTDL